MTPTAGCGILRVATISGRPTLQRSHLMGFMVRHWSETAKFTDAIRLDALERVVPYELIRGSAEAAAVPTQRRRKLPADVMVLLCVAMSLFTHDALDVVLHKLVHGLRLFWPDPDLALATKGALCQARYRLGARPVVALFHQVCRPLATPQTPGAFLFGLRLMALDGSVEDVPDSPANGRAFGRPHGGRGRGAFPQVQGVYLSECGTHAVVDAGFWPCHTSEREGAFRLLRSVGAGMLLLWDRGFHRFEMVEQTLARGAHVLGRLPAPVTVTPRWLLPHYAVRALMAEAAAQEGLAPTRLSFVHAVALLRVAIDDFHLVTPAQHPLLYQRLLRAIARCCLPERARRTNPRVIKRKMSNFALKRAAPSPPSQRLAPFREVVGILPQARPASADLNAAAAVDDQLDTGLVVPCLI